MASDPVVVFGAPRSGTTYLIEILNQHPAVFITNETRVFVWVHRALTEITRHPMTLAAHKERFVSLLEEQLPDLVRDFYRRLEPRAQVWGDKNPHYAGPANEGLLDTIRRLFPGARFVHIVRDGRDVVASLLRKRKPDGSDWIGFDGAHRIWVEHVRIGQEFGGALDDRHYCELRYEELVAHGPEVARRLVGFLGLRPSSEVDDFVAGQIVRRTPLSNPTRDLADPAGSDWAAVLGAEAGRSLELLAPTLRRLGYPVQSE